eukprot:TRINITY_DN25244_c0_g1_i1.p1 TRINITY_DN25244_c0_g1~~TRINITY_DN25244_c0_g1_i1.p1  ORF type:complete len:641 (+),score=126.72 TRINITY_DN25244_c0_g1_i1:58-1980(+)
MALHEAFNAGAASLPMLDADGELTDSLRDGEDEAEVAGAQVAKEASFPLASAAAAEAQGRRPAMEDAFAFADVGKEGCAFAVFDGHGGSGCALSIARGFEDAYPGMAARVGDDSAVEDLCLKLDAAFLQEFGGEDGAVENDSGSTGTFAFLTPTADASAYDVAVGNVGDSRVIAHRRAAGETEAMTVDHTPDLPEEHKRVTAAGGWVINNRVNGKLGVSRAFGDTFYKTAKDCRKHKVVAVPSVSRLRLVEGDVLLLCCDGVFEGEDVEEMTPDRAMEIVTAHLDSTPGDAGGAAVALCDAALANGSTDNCTAMVVILRAPPANPPPGGTSKAHAPQHVAKALVRKIDDPALGKSKPGEFKAFMQLVELTLDAGERSFGLEVEETAIHPDRGVRVTQVVKGGPAHRAWIRPGMYLVSVGGKGVGARTAVQRALAKSALSGRRALIMVRSDCPTWAKLRREHVATARSPSPPRRVPVAPRLTAYVRTKPSSRSKSASHARPGRGVPGQVERAHEDTVHRSRRDDTSYLAHHDPCAVLRPSSPSPKRAQFRKQVGSSVRHMSPINAQRNHHARSCTRKATSDLTQHRTGILDHVTLRPVGAARTLLFKHGGLAPVEASAAAPPPKKKKSIKRKRNGQAPHPP